MFLQGLACRMGAIVFCKTLKKVTCLSELIKVRRLTSGTWLSLKCLTCLWLSGSVAFLVSSFRLFPVTTEGSRAC